MRSLGYFHFKLFNNAEEVTTFSLSDIESVIIVMKVITVSNLTN